MGNLQSSLSSHSQEILDAAVSGNANWIKRQIEEAPKLIESVTTAKGLVKRRGVLHLAAKQGHADVISTVLEPLVERVRDEYKAQQEAPSPQDCNEQQQPDQLPQQQQEQQQPDVPQPRSATTAVVDVQQATVQEQRHQPQQEQQLPSFRLLRQTVNARDLYRRTPLIIAAKQGHLHCTQLLVEGAANLFAIDREGNTCLHYAALHGHLEVVEYLLQKARDRNLATRFANKRNLSGFTALHYAVWGANEQLVLHLLQVGADVSVVNDRVFDAWVTVPVGSTPLHLAVVRNHMPIALMLLQHYVLQLIASPSDVPQPEDPRAIVNLYGMNPSQLAAHRGHRQLARVLMPTLSLSRVLEAFEPADAPRAYGPPSLKVIAAGVMQAKLTQDLENLEQQQCTQEQCTQEAPAVQHLQEDSGKPALVVDTAAADACCDLQCCCSGAGTSCSDTPCCARICSGETSSDSMLCNDTSGGFTVDEVSSHASSSELLGSFEIIQGLMPADAAAAAATAEKAAGCSSCSGCSAAAASVAAAASASQPTGLNRATSSGWYDEQCCVCWEEAVLVGIGPCLHALCLGCAKQLVQTSSRVGATCPLCRCYIASFGMLPMRSGNKLKLVGGAGI